MVSKRAGDIMIPLDEYPHIPHWFTLRQAVVEMEKSELERDGRRSLPRALLVFDEKYQLLGIVRRRDILRGLEPKYLRTMPVTHRKKLFDVEANEDLLELSSGRFAEALDQQAEQLVSEIMQPVAATVDINDHIAKVIYKMISRDLNLIPVLSGDTLVGAVRSVDVFREVAEMLIQHKE
jgi:CBS-domain-containing membrane protein